MKQYTVQRRTLNGSKIHIESLPYPPMSRDDVDTLIKRLDAEGDTRFVWHTRKLEK